MRWIRVAVDGSRASTHALRWAADLAREKGATLEVATAFGTHGRVFGDPLHLAPGDNPEEAVRERQLELVAEVVDEHEDLDLKRTIMLGHPAERLCKVPPVPALLVLGTRGVGGFLGLLIGSTAHQVIEHAPCPVVVVPDADEPPRPPDRIVVGVDGSREAERALSWAVQQARGRDASLEIVVAWQPMVLTPTPFAVNMPTVSDTSASDLAEEVLRRAMVRVDTSGAKTTWTVTKGQPASVLLGRAQDNDLLVLGAPGAEHALHLGSTAHRCLKHAPCPVAIAR